MFSGMATRAVRGIKKCQRRAGDTTTNEDSERSIIQTEDSCIMNTPPKKRQKTLKTELIME